MDLKPKQERSWHSIVFTILVTPVACLTAYFTGSMLAEHVTQRENRAAAAPSLPAGLFIEPTELNLGEVWETPDYEATLRLQNTSDRDIAVSKFSTSCDCSGIEPPSPVIPAKGSVQLRVKINLTHRLPFAWGVERRPFSLAISPMLTEGGGGAPNGWEIKAIIKSRVSLSALRLEFADQCTHGGPLVRRTVRATAYVPLQALEAIAKPEIATVHVEPVRDALGQYEITIAPDPKLPLGPFRCEVAIVAVTGEGVRYRCASIQVTGQMQAATRIVPGIVLLGEYPVGSKATAEVSVRFPEHTAWTVDRVVSESPQLKLTSNGSFADGARRYRVTQKIAERGDQKSKLTFIIRKGDGTWETVELKVLYHGMPVAAANGVGR